MVYQKKSSWASMQRLNGAILLLARDYMNNVMCQQSINSTRTRPVRHQHQPEPSALRGKLTGREPHDLQSRFGRLLVGSPAMIRLTLQIASDRVTQLAETQRRQSICRFARLRKGDHQAVTTHGGFAVAEFRGDFHIARHASQRFKPVARPSRSCRRQCRPQSECVNSRRSLFALRIKCLTGPLRRD